MSVCKYFTMQGHKNGGFFKYCLNSWNGIPIDLNGFKFAILYYKINIFFPSEKVQF